jgi:hypothetical protein
MQVKHSPTLWAEEALQTCMSGLAAAVHHTLLTLCYTWSHVLLQASHSSWAAAGYKRGAVGPAGAAVKRRRTRTTAAKVSYAGMLDGLNGFCLYGLPGGHFRV